MATPYLQFRYEMVPSTQDLARQHHKRLPVLVQATGQSSGRGRAGTEWLNAPRALAASLAFQVSPSDQRPFSLMAGVAAARAAEGTALKWPNDVQLEDLKVGGILVERAGDLVVIGFGLNLWWPDAPPGATGLYESDPGSERHAEIGGLWGAELMHLVDSEGWPQGEYQSLCRTIGADITWEPDGSGRAVDVAVDGGLVVEKGDGEQTTIYSGAVRHIRRRDGQARGRPSPQ